MRVTVHVGLTFQVGPMSSNQYGRVDVTLADIDSEVEIHPQIQGGIRATQVAFKAALIELDSQVEALYSSKS